MLYLYVNKILIKMGLNRIKAVLAERGKTNKWLAASLKKGEPTVSKWCTNSSQPDIATLKEIANLLEVDIKDLLNSTKEYNTYGEK